MRIFHRRQCSCSNSGQNGANLGLHAHESHAVLSLLLISTWSLASCGRLAGCRALVRRPNIVVPVVGHTCTTGRGRIIDCAVISDSLRPFWRGITLEYNSPCKPHTGICLQFTATPTQVRVRQACFPKSFAFSKTVEEMVPSRKRLAAKAKPEEPTRRDVNSCCKAEHWDCAA